MINRPFVAAASMLAATILVTAPAHASAALTHGAVHLLGGPATTFGSVADVPGNSQVGVLWCGPANFDWCLIQFHKKQGWVQGGELSALGAKADAAEDANNNGNPSAPDGASGGGGNAEGAKTARLTESRQDPSSGPSAGSVGSGGSHAVGAGL